MRLADFILANTESILVEWEAFARSIWPSPLIDAANDPGTLRDHAEDILRSTARDMVAEQSASQQFEKSKGGGVSDGEENPVNTASGKHGSERVGSGFELWALVAEYRAYAPQSSGNGVTAARTPTFTTSMTSRDLTSPSTSRLPDPSAVTPNKSKKIASNWLLKSEQRARRQKPLTAQRTCFWQHSATRCEPH